MTQYPIAAGTTILICDAYPAVVQGHGVMPDDCECVRYRGQPAYRVRYHIIDQLTGTATDQLEDHDTWVIERHATGLAG